MFIVQNENLFSTNMEYHNTDTRQRNNSYLPQANLSIYQRGPYYIIIIIIIAGFETFFYVVRHIDSTASYLPTGLLLGSSHSWPSLFLPSSYSSVFLMHSFVLASTSMLRTLLLGDKNL
jgi:hypothetical protein